MRAKEQCCLVNLNRCGGGNTKTQRDQKTEVKECPKGYLVAFTLNVQAPQGPANDTAANSIQFSCGDGVILEGESPTFGTYGQWSKRCTAGAICGIQTKVEALAPGDSTALNHVRFFCCD
ncbi:Hypothetical predicted protein [Podarcis lilfordi]|uniref:Sushi domain-containing protein n=1 Tax=Podarcis lilfordi TaxID=74358 RepID=A0AA35P2L7_9SAUR|nr:Hypothetical predicted protein [Podarcis lilfordi]